MVEYEIWDTVTDECVAVFDDYVLATDFKHVFCTQLYNYSMLYEYNDRNFTWPEVCISIEIKPIHYYEKP